MSKRPVIAQHYRDARIAAIYEGTNGIQAADLVGRKLPMRGGGVVFDHLDGIAEIAAELRASDDLKAFGDQLDSAVGVARRSAAWLLTNGADDPNQALAGSTPFLRLLGTVVCGGLMGRLGLAAANDDTSGAPEFLAAKVVSARFFGEQILPTVVGLESVITAGADDLFAITPDRLR